MLDEREGGEHEGGELRTSKSDPIWLCRLGNELLGDLNDQTPEEDFPRITPTAKFSGTN